MPEPAQQRGTSRQDYCTPVELLRAVLEKLGAAEFAFDFAADEQNSVATCFWNEAVDSLSQDAERWADMTARGAVEDGWGWCNPPFKRLGPWARRWLEMSHLPAGGGKVAALVPAGVGSNWWRDFVHDKAHVLFLNGRPTFEGATDAYPKDVAILIYGDWDRFPPGYHVWSWRDAGGNADGTR